MHETGPRLDILELFLDQIGEQLQLTPTQVKDAEAHYNAVAAWLAKPESPLASLGPEIFTQGSLRLRTTVKPLGRDEYDLDLVFQVDSWDQDPAALITTVYKRIVSSEIYRGIVEPPLARCIRLTYAKQFHLDIVPARIASGGAAIEIPDRQPDGSYAWKTTHPKGYAEWFEKAAELPIGLMELRASIEPMPQQESFADKPPLRRLVQLLKRWRDVRLAGNPAEVSSIILTTLAGDRYAKEVTVADSLTRFLALTTSEFRPLNIPPTLRNPVNSAEVISERWRSDSKTFFAFREQLERFAIDWGKIIHSSTDAKKRRELLNGLFGEEVAASSWAKAAGAVSGLREAGRLGIIGGSGALSLGSKPIPRNNFYGDDSETKAS